jgi:hypothetical protein
VRRKLATPLAEAIGVDSDVLRAMQADCPIPSRISPHAAAVQDWLNGWLRGFALPLDLPDLERLGHADSAYYASRLYPDATRADLQTIAALFTWFFLLDDVCDGPPGAAAPDVRGLCDGVLHTLRHDPPGRHPAFAGPLRRMLVRVWQPPRLRMGPEWQARFLDAVSHHVDGILVEAANKAVARRPSVADYVELRRATSAAYVAYALIEFTTGTPLPAAVHHHPLVREIAATANDLLSWFNDLASLERDTATSGGHNLVLAVAHEEGVPVDVAFSAVVHRWRETMCRFGELRAAVPSFGPAIDGPLHRYLDGVAGSIRGTIDWSLESARYAGASATPGTITRSPYPAALPASGPGA